MDGIVLTGFHAVAEAQTAVLTDGVTTATHLGSCQTVVDAFVIALFQQTDGLAFGVLALVAGAADHGHTANGLLCLDAHDLSHLGSALVAAGGTFADGSFALQHGFCVAAATCIAAAAAVGTREALIQLVQTGVGFYIKDLGGDGQNQAENQTQTA